MPPQPKKAAPVPAAGAGQPPWAMVSPDGTDLYFPTKPEDAQTFAKLFGAQPVNSEGFPWPSILTADGKIKLGDGADIMDQIDDEQDALAGFDETPSDAPSAVETEQGGSTVPEVAPTPSAPVRRARKASQATAPADLLSYCPTPDYCFPLGLPDDVSHVACVHGSSS